MIDCTGTLPSTERTQRDDCYKQIANGLINHVVRLLEAHLAALELIIILTTFL